MTPKPAGAGSVTASDTPATSPPSRYSGPKDVGRAESLYRSAVSKPDLACAAEAQRAGLGAHAVALGGRVLEQVESGEDVPKAASVARLIELFEACGAME